MDAVNLEEIEGIARSKVPARFWDYIQCGAGSGSGLAENRAGFERIKLLPRVLNDVRVRDQSTTLFGTSLSIPVVLSPTSYLCMLQPDADVAAVRAAQQTGSLAACGTLTSCTIGEIASAVPDATLWFQLYAYRNLSTVEQLTRAAETAGCRAIIVTVDAPYTGRRERILKSKFQLPETNRLGNLDFLDLNSAADTDRSAAYRISHVRQLPLTWPDIDQIRKMTDLPLILKGILAPADARRAVNCGANGLVVSNHGGRQLEAAPASIDALPGIVDTVGEQVTILLDSGVRRGSDVVKALALGADAVLIGRPYIWGLAADGENGVREVINILRAEIDNVLAQLGCADLKELGSQHIWQP